MFAIYRLTFVPGSHEPGLSHHELTVTVNGAVAPPVEISLPLTEVLFKTLKESAVGLSLVAVGVDGMRSDPALFSFDDTVPDRPMPPSGLRVSFVEFSDV